MYFSARKHEAEIMAELNADKVFGDRKISSAGESFQVSVPSSGM